GWALYSEELMAEPRPGHPNGFYTAAEHLYELQGQLLRAVRVRVDVGIHTGRLSFDEAVDYFTEHVSFYPRACPRRPQPGGAGDLRGRTARAVPLLQVAHAGDHLQSGKERDRGAARRG